MILWKEKSLRNLMKSQQLQLNKNYLSNLWIWLPQNCSAHALNINLNLSLKKTMKQSITIVASPRKILLRNRNINLQISSTQVLISSKSKIKSSDPKKTPRSLNVFIQFLMQFHELSGEIFFIYLFWCKTWVLILILICIS